MPPVIIASSMKKTRLSRMAGVISSRHPVAVKAPPVRAGAANAGATACPRTASRSIATAKPRMPAPMKAPRQPHRLCIVSRLTGATAEPIIPAKL